MMSKSVSTTTMPTPISDLTPTPEVPSGFPDVATLARMANAFFTALPGATAAEEGTSVLEKSPDNISVTDPSAASGVTRRVLATAPGAASSVPPTPGSAIPNITPPGAPAFSSAIPGTTLPGAPVPPQAPGHPAPTSPFYFLDYVGSGSAIPGITPPGTPALSSAIPGIAPPSASAPGAALPNFAAPAATLPGAAISGTSPPQPPGNSASPSPFYFLDYAGSGWDALPGAASAALDSLAALAAHPTALPMGVDLSALRAPPAPAAGSFAAVPTPGGLPSFYFLESTPTDVATSVGVDSRK